MRSTCCRRLRQRPQVLGSPTILLLVSMLDFPQDFTLRGNFFSFEASLRFCAFSQSRKPPIKASALSPARQPGGSSLSFLTLPPPITISSGCSAAISRSTTSATFFRHFFLPYLSRARLPT